ncbi:hypothetical protein MSG28_016106 [Choristoneura fumiferana]|uniref:Uncharacterized protein n=1 Tax=Choristoneura fumiferana TaxID=7141 RepID=A0ACC0K5V2_CHOFU|nr:hypothetical protein MSG28_016106 [Choristoneura fumiferana]
MLNRCRWWCYAACSCSLGGARGVRRLAERLGARLDDLHRDMRYLLDSGEYADARLSFAAEGGGQFGFRAALELPCHRVVLAARSRFFSTKADLSLKGSLPVNLKVERHVAAVGGGGRGGGGGAGGGVAAGVVCVDEKVLPRRFARALLHAAYTDQVDLTLIGRSTNSPNNTSSSGSGWSVGRGSSRAPSTAMLDDAFQLYEIARFLEMPIVAQGCEDAIQAALCPETLPHILRWTATSVASPWVHRYVCVCVCVCVWRETPGRLTERLSRCRQAMRYLRDEFPTIMSNAAAARLPRAALAAALGSPFTQCSEAQALRALLRLAERGKQPEPNVVWSSSAEGGRRRSLPDAEALGPLAALLRTSHLAPAALAAAARRGLLPPAPAPPRRPPLAPTRARPDTSCPTWTSSRWSYNALLEDQPVPEAEIARIRRSRNQHRIPDTLYMVAAERNATTATTQPASCSAAESACVSPRVLASLRARVRELRSAPPAARALALQASDTRAVRTQVREGDSCEGEPASR